VLLHNGTIWSLSPISHGKYDHTPIGFRGSRSLSALRQLTIIPTSQDEAQRCVQIVEALQILRDSKTHRRGSQCSSAKAAHDAQKKMRSFRQKIDTQILGSKIVNDNNYGFYHRSNTSIATVGTPELGLK
jgi:hypothetical protein